MIDILVPAEQEGSTATVRAWLKNIGEAVAANDPLVELETDKVTLEVSAPAAGILEEILLSRDAAAGPGALLGRLRPAAVIPAGAPAPAAVPPPAPTAPRFSPAVRTAAIASGIDPARLTGTGAGGRVTRADMDAASRAAAADSRIPHSTMRRQIAAAMTRSVATAPHVTSIFEADMSAVLAHRRASTAPATLTAYFIAAAAGAMRAAPAINSRWHDEHLELFADANIGIGTALGDAGLVVPVIHRAQTLSLVEIAARLADLTARARAGRLAPEDVRGGTFTISNHGVSGSLLAAPVIINQPQSAILGIGKVEKRVIVREIDGADAIQIRPLCYVSLTIDHRVVDGFQANTWLAAFTKVLESWK